MRDYESEFQNRVEFIRNLLAESGATGVVYGNSGGKDSALVGILCKAACDNTVGLLLPCTSKRNYGEDRADAETVAAQFHIETRTVDLTPVKEAEMEALKGVTVPNAQALANLAPRLRMLTLYAVAASENRLVAGTGNRSEAYVGYFTKWGDGAHDFNPIADLTVTEVYEFLRFLNAPDCILASRRPPLCLTDRRMRVKWEFPTRNWTRSWQAEAFPTISAGMSSECIAPVSISGRESPFTQKNKCLLQGCLVWDSLQYYGRGITENVFRMIKKSILLEIQVSRRRFFDTFFLYSNADKP